jgi:mono/diheme cytochrome c family protein
MLFRLTRSTVLASVVATAASGTLGCVVEADDDDPALAAAAGLPDPPPVFLDQGWSDGVRAAFYQTSQGSRMLPYAWFLHLEQAGSRQAFRAAANMRRMGFLVDGPSPSNPDGLPVGFARDDHPVRGAAIGLTCAACHTGELEYQGTRVRIDGGQSLSDLEQLQDGLLASLEATLADSAKFKRFADAVLGSRAGAAERAALRAEVETRRAWWQARVTRSRGLTPHGPSRTDAFTIIGNEVVCDLLGIPENCAPGVAPTQFPFLWGTPDFDWVQYNSSVHSPLGRNVGEVTGVFAEARLAPDGTVDSSADILGLDALENWLKSLRAPAWPEEIFGAIDADLAAQGAAIYAATCASCHTLDPQPRTEPNAFGVTFARVNFSTPLGALGTDPTAALAFATRRADPGPWRPIAEAQGLVGPDGKVAVAALLSISGSMIIQKFFALAGLSDFEKLYFLGFRESLSPSVAQLTTYKARPLDGIAFTAPYLHNGSVASIYELLLPPAQRMTQFYVGTQDYDPVRLGYSTSWSRNAVLLDTTALGNSNAGHVYGTDLADPERMALIEYLKTL